MATSLLICLFLTFFLFFFFAAIAKFTRQNTTGRAGNVLPPGPPVWPVFGNIFQVGLNPHRSITLLSKKYGAVMSLKLGKVATIVISSPEAAKEALKTHDHVLSARTFNDPVRAFDQHQFSVIWGPPSSRWRFLRKITSTHLLSIPCLEANQSVRNTKINDLLSFVTKQSKKEEAIDIARASFVTALNIISNALFSLDLASYEYSSNTPSFHDFHNTVMSLLEVSGKPNVGDYFPFLKFLDLQGAYKEAMVCVERLFKVFQQVIDDRIDKRLNRRESKENLSVDMLESLLDLTQEKESEFTMNDIKHLLLAVFTAGTDTSSSTVEWAMTELLCNPEKLTKAQTEIRQVIGQNGVVQESDISKLNYLQAIVKETLRLHPPAPLIPRKSESDLQIFGFHIPKNSPVLVNVWGIGRDPNVWENPMKFEPERFSTREIDVKGKNFELLPFGSGRRMCPGMWLALRTVPFMLASLLYSFDWKLQNGVVSKDIDMSEVFGVTLHKAKPLYAIPINKKL